jgi:hypothetical protein
VLFPYLHVLYFDQVHPLLLFLIPSPFLKHYNGFHYSIFIPVNEVLWSYSPPLHHLISSFPLMLLSTPKQSPQFILTSFFFFFFGLIIISNMARTHLVGISQRNADLLETKRHTEPQGGLLYIGDWSASLIPDGLHAVSRGHLNNLSSRLSFWTFLKRKKNPSSLSFSCLVLYQSWKLKKWTPISFSVWNSLGET